MTIFKASRALTVRSAAIPEVSGAPALVPLKLQGREGINSLFHYTLALQTPDALQFSGIGSNFRLDDFIGREITCSIELEGMGSFQAGMPGGLGASHQGAGVREISGLITAARFCTEDHRHAIYELEIRPWLYLATLTTDCKVFQDKTPVEVIEAVLAGYNFASDKRLIETYPPRDYCVQYNETNFEFITRLMQEWGINYHFEHTAGVHRLVWSDHNGAFQAASQDQGEGPGACHDIPYYPLGHKIDREYIHGFSPTGRITSGAYATRDHDYTRPRATLEASARDPRPTGHADSEIYAWRGAKAGVGGSDYSQPRAGSDTLLTTMRLSPANGGNRIDGKTGALVPQTRVGEVCPRSGVWAASLPDTHPAARNLAIYHGRFKNVRAGDPMPTMFARFMFPQTADADNADITWSWVNQG